MEFEKKVQFRRGLRDGVPIMLGYLAVAFTMGIAARGAGVNAFQAALISFGTHASAGEFVGYTLIAAGAAYVELALMEAVANARYLLMSCALSQRLAPGTSMLHRLLIGFGITDEIFGISMAQPGYLSPWYAYGATLISLSGWTMGAALGVLMGNILPTRVVSALGVGLYGMFLAVIVPPARRERFLCGVILVSMGVSLAVSVIPIFAALSEGVRIILLTVLLSAAAALLRPVSDADDAEAKEAI